MSLQQWAENGWLRPHQTSQQEIDDLYYRTIAALPEILGEKWRDAADYLETCRRKRNIVEYDRTGIVTEQDVSELAAFCRELR